MRSLSGFTLIEMMVVVAIAGVMAAIATPSFMELIEYKKLQEQTEEVRDVLLRARGRARAKNICINVQVQAVASGIQLTSTPKNDGECKSRALYYAIAEGVTTFAGASTHTLAGTNGAVTSTTVGKDLGMASSQTVFFDPRGGIFSELPVAITLTKKSDGSALKKLRIIPGTGLVRTVTP